MTGKLPLSDAEVRAAVQQGEDEAARERAKRLNPVPDVDVGTHTAKGSPTNPRAKLTQPGSNSGTTR